MNNIPKPGRKPAIAVAMMLMKVAEIRTGRRPKAVDKATPTGTPMAFIVVAKVLT
jgi:hypothetical protein